MYRRKMEIVRAAGQEFHQGGIQRPAGSGRMRPRRKRNDSGADIIAASSSTARNANVGAHQGNRRVEQSLRHQRDAAGQVIEASSRLSRATNSMGLKGFTT
jgi:hypothetical protein